MITPTTAATMIPPKISANARNKNSKMSIAI